MTFESVPIYVSGDEFDKLIKHPEVSKSFRYYIKDFSIVKDGVVVNPQFERGILYCGVNFVVKDE